LYAFLSILKWPAVVWTLVVPVVLLVLAFGHNRVDGTLGFQLGLGLAVLWYLSLVAFPEPSNVLMDGYPYQAPRNAEKVILVQAVANWVALHQLTRRLGSRFGWLLHLLIAVPFGGIVFVAALLKFGGPFHW
jgi:hypothetical protein